MQLNAQEIYIALDSGQLTLLGPAADYPFERSQIQPASVDLRLGSRFMRFLPGVEHVDTRRLKESGYLEKLTEVFFCAPEEPLVLRPHEVVYGQVYEMMAVGKGLSARIEGRSRAARLGLSIHCTGAYINPGYEGAMPLQLVNHNHFSISLYPYMDICQLILYRLAEEPILHYGDGNAYQGENAPRLSVLSPDKRPGELQRLKEEKIRRLMEQYVREHPQGRDSTAAAGPKQGPQVSTTYIVKEGGQVSNYNTYGSQVGNMGDHAGENASTQFFGGLTDVGDVQELLKELTALRRHLRELEDSEADELLGETAKLSRALTDKDGKAVSEVLRACGKKLLDVAKTVGCSLLTRYLADQLGMN